MHSFLHFFLHFSLDFSLVCFFLGFLGSFFLHFFWDLRFFNVSSIAFSSFFLARVFFERFFLLHFRILKLFKTAMIEQKIPRKGQVQSATSLVHSRTKLSIAGFFVHFCSNISILPNFSKFVLILEITGGLGRSQLLKWHTKQEIKSSFLFFCIFLYFLHFFLRDQKFLDFVSTFFWDL